MGIVVLDGNVDPKALRVNSSVTTIFSLINSMIGGTMLLLPTLFEQAGIITSMIIMVPSAYISYKTVTLYLLHMRDDELDIQAPTKRLLGHKWYKFFMIILTVYMFLLCLLYFVFVVQMSYDIICFIILKASSGQGQYVPISIQNEFTFSIFSQQWMTLIVFFPLLAMLFMKNFTFLVKLAGIGVLAIFAYVIFVFYAFFSNLGNMDKSGCVDKKALEPSACIDMPLLTGSIGNLGGTAALAFTIHTNFAPMIKCNMHQEMNFRDLKYVFLAGFVIYSAIGLFGSFGILNRVTGASPSLITDYFPDNPASVVVWVLYLLHLVSVLPVFFDISRARLIQLVYGKREPPKWFMPTVNVTFMVLCSIIKNIPGLNPADITNLAGSLCCFFFVYLIPILLHLVCYHEKYSFVSRFVRKPSMMLSGESDDRSMLSMPIIEGGASSTDSGLKNVKDTSKGQDKYDSNHSHSGIDGSPHADGTNEAYNYGDPLERYRCAHHERDNIEAVKPIWRIVFYSLILVVGVFVMVEGLYQVIITFVK